MTFFKVLTIVTICGSINVRANDLGPYTNRQRIYDQYMSLGSLTILSGSNCNLTNVIDNQLYDSIKPDKIGQCIDRGLTDVMSKYSNIDNFVTNPKFMCETYGLTHNCIRNFIPYLGLCLNNVTNSTATKLYSGGEIGLNVLCENDAQIYSIIYRNRNKKCVKHFLRRYDQKFKDIWGLSEPTIFSSEMSCTILSMMVRKIQNRPPHCNEQLANTLKSGIENFWTKSGCNDIITFS